MVDQNHCPEPRRPLVEGESRSSSLDGSVRTDDFPNIDGQCQPIREMDDSQLVGVPAAVAGVPAADSTLETVKMEEVKRKRGRPPRGQGKPPPAKKPKEEEDVCFICFDGGSLVLCDRRGCPKAYHPACIKRDEAFFRSKAKWNCGWHICSVCQKAAHYMCYTCTYSLCKGCTKDADYLCVRGDKGFCVTCMKTIMLIENKDQGDKAQVDFDDQGSWEYLFKIYWVYLRDKLSLTSTELSQAKNPWKEPGTMACKGPSPVVNNGTNDVNIYTSNRSSGHLEVSSSVTRNSNESLKILNEDSQSPENPGNDKGSSFIGCTDWATKELLDFVAHMKNGDTSLLSQFDVQELLLDYIKRNNLRDPRCKSHILCDSRLKTLFDKPRVGHFEMLKLLEYHFLIKEEPPKDVSIRGGVVDVNAIQVLADENNDTFLGKEKKRKTRKKGEERPPQTNLNEYAAIDVHNINLIYLRRNLMENLIEDKENFHDKVVGSVVRIRISGGEPKQDMYRLVQVVGTTTVSVPYKISNRTADVIVEVLNLDKKEAVSIDKISNQDFSEDECRRLRQSIKCGLVKRFTVGEIQEKAMALKAVRLNDWLDTEMLRLNHLCDRASENGRKKELRECVEKLQLLKTPEERERRLRQIPDVHCDPNMDPNYESEEDAGELENRKQGEYVKPGYSGYNREASKAVSLRKRGNISGDTGSRARNSLTPPSERSRNMCTTSSYLDKEESAAKALQRLKEGIDACRSNGMERPGTATAPLSVGPTLSGYNSETKLWNYRDPNGRIQGPFCMVQLRKWSTTGYFPPDMKIWAGDRQNETVLLTDALNGKFHKAFSLLNEVPSQSREIGGASDSKLYNSKQTEGNMHGNIAAVHFHSNNELGRSDRLGTHSSVWTAPVVSYKKEITAGRSSQDQDSFKVAPPLQVHHSPLSSSTLSGRELATPLHHEITRFNSDPDNENQMSHGQIPENHSNSQGFSGPSSGENWIRIPVNFSSKNLDLNTTLSVTKSSDSPPDQNDEASVTNLQSPSRKTSNGGWEGEATENKESVSSSFHVQDSDILDLRSPTPNPSNEYQKGQAIENKQPASSDISIHDTGPGPSCGSASSLVVNGLTDITDDWGGYSPTPVKRSVELTDFFPPHPVSNMSSWQTAVSEPIEFSTLAEESVSDLLAEVDAMESQRGLPSPTSAMNCGVDLINLNL